MSSNFKNLYTSNNPPLQATLIRGSNIESIHKVHAVISDKKGRNKNYIQVWITLLNTVKKGEVEKQAVRILHQTNCQRSC